ncbi:type II 3-dehydroquinate dehydratase [Chishuiella sp.]|uniref:type II 3-dehydroquinate dehydratase n=1 Tax=Chishuiella sp. TaxID=1969467 RepID=UPI0028AF9EEC|nr:type II 3-dehydroquinate dehydratase [Chishuiella sp.]
MKQIQIINGPNLNLLGIREPEIYGTETFEDFFVKLQHQYPDLSLHYYQSNHEGDIIDKLHEIGFKYDGIILNAGAYSHYSYAISDAIKSITTKVIEVHISDIYAREDFRKISITGESCLKMITGKGLPGYNEAIESFLK